jgi:prepilin-type processing-associated H-X9-DG protein
MNRMKQYKSGVTLIELLTVTGIIVLLVALLLPVVFRARETAYMYYCLNNMQVLGKAYHAYAHDYNDGIVPLISDSKLYTGISWHGALKPYGAEILADEGLGSTGDHWIKCPVADDTYTSYAQNDAVGFKDYHGAFRQFPSTFSQIPGLGRTVLAGEDHCMAINSKELTSGFGRDWGQVHYRHGPTPHFGKISQWGRWEHGIGNVLFCDGHAESILWENNWLTVDNVVIKQE